MSAMLNLEFDDARIRIKSHSVHSIECNDCACQCDCDCHDCIESDCSWDCTSNPSP